MKILITATVQSHICQFHKPLVEMLHEHGCEVHVAARDNLAEKNGLQLDFADKVFNVPFSRSPKSPDNIKAYRMVKKIIQEGHYDVIHCNTPVGGVLTRLAARKARKHGTRVYYTAHGFHFYQGAPRKNWIVFYPVEKFFADHFTDKLLTITEEDYNLASELFCCEVLRTHGVGVDERRYFAVDDAEKKRLREKMGFAPEQKIILNVGELLPNKNQLMAIRMMPEIVKDFPDTLLLIAGNGPEKEHLEREIQTLGMEEHIRLLGYMTNLQEYQHIADVLVACSNREGLPLNVVEAMLSDTLAVATDNRGHRELIQDGIDGYLVPKNDVAAMSQRVKECLADNASMQSMKTQAKDRAVSYIRLTTKRELEKIYFR